MPAELFLAIFHYAHADGRKICAAMGRPIRLHMAFQYHSLEEALMQFPKYAPGGPD